MQLITFQQSDSTQVNQRTSYNLNSNSAAAKQQIMALLISLFENNVNVLSIHQELSSSKNKPYISYVFRTFREQISEFKKCCDDNLALSYRITRLEQRIDELREAYFNPATLNGIPLTLCCLRHIQLTLPEGNRGNFDFSTELQRHLPYLKEGFFDKPDVLKQLNQIEQMMRV